MALTDTFVKNTKHTGKASGDKHSDAHGLYLHITATGKYRRMAYRFTEKQKTLALGVYPAVSLSIARAGRTKARKLLAVRFDLRWRRRTGAGSRSELKRSQWVCGDRQVQNLF